LFERNTTLEILSAKNRELQIWIPLKPGADLGSIREFLRAFKNVYRGGVADVLKLKLGWASKVDTELMRWGSNHYAIIDAKLTSLGYSRRDEVAQWILRAIQEAGRVPYTQDLIENLRKSVRESAKKSLSITDLVRTYPNWMLTSEGNADLLRFDVEGVVARITSEKIQQGALALNIDNGVLTSFLGPDATGADQKSELFNLRYGVRVSGGDGAGVGAVDVAGGSASGSAAMRVGTRASGDVAAAGSAAAASGPTSPAGIPVPVRESITAPKPMTEPAPVPVPSPADIAFPHVELPAITSSGSIVTQNQVERESGWTLISQYQPEIKERAVGVRLDFGRLSSREQLALEAWVSSLIDQIAPEIRALASKGVYLKVNVDGPFVQLTSSGKNELEFTSLVWLLERLKNHRPTDVAIDFYKDMQLAQLMQHEDGRPGILALRLGLGSLSKRPVSPIEKLLQIPQLKLSDVSRFLSDRLSKSEKVVVVAGGYRAEELKALRRGVEDLSPRFFEPSLQQVLPCPILRQPVVHTEGWSDPEKTTLGLARICTAPQSQSASAKAAMVIIATALHDPVFLKARPLGYIQQVSMIPSGPEGDGYVAFFGQAKDASKGRDLRKIWDHEIAQWQRGLVTDEDIEKARQGIISSLESPPTTSEELLNLAFAQLVNWGEVRTPEERVAVYQGVSLAEIRSVAQKMFDPGTATLNVAKGVGGVMSCDDLLEGRRFLRRQVL